MKKDTEEIIKIFKYAIKAETDAFTAYYEGSKRVKVPELRGILIYLAEEERKHRLLLLNEYNKIKSYEKTSLKKPTETKKDITKYRIPKSYLHKALRPFPNIDTAGISLPMEIVSGDYLDTFSIMDSFPLAVLLILDSIVICSSNGRYRILRLKQQKFLLLLSVS